MILPNHFKERNHEISALPHLDNERFPDNSLANLEKLAAGIPVPTYLIDDQTAIKVADDTIDISSGTLPSGQGELIVGFAPGD